jgi:hypothetical protein
VDAAVLRRGHLRAQGVQLPATPAIRRLHMHKQAKVAAFAAMVLLSSVGGSSAALKDGSSTWQGTRAELRETCQNINGVLIESHGKTRCYSAFRASLYICKDNGFCQTQYWNGENAPSGGHNQFGGESLSESGEDYGNDAEGGVIIIM